MSYGFDADEALEAAGYKFEFEYGYWGYDWNITKVYTHDGHIFALNDGGCSCSGWGDRWDDVQEVIGDMYEVASLPSAIDLGEDWERSNFDEKTETIQERFRALGLR